VWNTKHGWLCVMSQTAVHATDLVLRVLGKVIGAHVFMDNGVGTPSFDIGGQGVYDQEKHDKVQYRLSVTRGGHGHFTRMNGTIQVMVRGQGQCAFLVAATHTVPCLLNCKRDAHGVPENPVHQEMEDNEAARLRQATVELLKSDHWSEIPATGSTAQKSSRATGERSENMPATEEEVSQSVSAPFASAGAAVGNNSEYPDAGAVEGEEGALVPLSELVGTQV
jgi:hypothetical protein